jgi:hypothetical protein
MHLERNRTLLSIGPERNDDVRPGRVLDRVGHGLKPDEVECGLELGLETPPVHERFHLDAHVCG